MDFLVTSLSQFASKIIVMKLHFFKYKFQTTQSSLQISAKLTLSYHSRLFPEISPKNILLSHHFLFLKQTPTLRFVIPDQIVFMVHHSAWTT